MQISELTIQDRVELHPATDEWMRGARYGAVTSFDNGWVVVKLDRLPEPLRVAPRDILRRV